MRPPVLIVARQSATLLGLAQAVLKFGYQMVTAYPDAAEIERAVRVGPALVVVRPPAEEEARRRCLQLVQTHLKRVGLPILVCVSSKEEEQEVRGLIAGVPTLVGSPLKLNDLYLRMHEMFDLAKRKELRIRTELAVAHREPGLYAADYFNYDTLRSLSAGGCFIETKTPYPNGTAIEMVFCVGVGSRSLHLTGKVIRNGRGDTDAEIGMGVEFAGLSDEERSLLEGYLMSQLGTLELPATL